MEYPKSDYKEYPKTLAPDDFWGQVRRTCYGKPVTEDQIQMIVQAIKTGLALKPEDTLLDIACGNGALSRYFFSSCHSFLGVDHSQYLIEVAKNNFEKLPHYQFILNDVVNYVQNEADPQQFTKALCYGSFSFLDKISAAMMLLFLAKRFTQIKYLYLGNLPDKTRAFNFYQRDLTEDIQLYNHETQIGIWRSKEELSFLAANTGWRIKYCHYMSKEFFASHYRFDLVLERQMSC